MGSAFDRYLSGIRQISRAVKAPLRLKNSALTALLIYLRNSANGRRLKLRNVCKTGTRLHKIPDTPFGHWARETADLKHKLGSSVRDPNILWTNPRFEAAIWQFRMHF